ncbi:MAG: hypothetical protein ACRDAS_00545 [Cetobacterium sp.]
MDCKTCKHTYYENDFMYCRVDVHDNEFMLDCEHMECPHYVGDDNV